MVQFRLDAEESHEDQGFMYQIQHAQAFPHRQTHTGVYPLTGTSSYYGKSVHIVYLCQKRGCLHVVLLHWMSLSMNGYPNVHKCIFLYMYPVTGITIFTSQHSVYTVLGHVQMQSTMFK